MQGEQKQVCSWARCLIIEAILERRGGCSPWDHSPPPSSLWSCSLVYLSVASLLLHLMLLSSPCSEAPVCRDISICPYWSFSPFFSLFSPPPYKMDLLLVCKTQPDFVCLLNGSICCLQRSEWFSFLNDLADISSRFFVSSPNYK